MKPLIPYFDQPIIEIPLPFEVFGSDVLPLHGFGLLVAIGFLVGSRIAMNRAARVGLDADAVNRLVGWLVIGTFVGGHVGYGLFYQPTEYLADPIKFLYVWEGLWSMGGIVTCLVLSLIFFKRESMKVWPYLDCLTIGFAMGWFFGRMGCFVAHDHPGTVTDFWLGVQGICPGYAPGDASVACHDMGLYEAIWSLAVFALFTLLDRKPRFPGFYTLLFFLIYGPTRLAMDFVRPEANDARYAMLTPSQWVVLVLFVGALGVFWKRMTSGDEPVWAPPGTRPAPAETKGG